MRMKSPGATSAVVNVGEVPVDAHSASAICLVEAGSLLHWQTINECVSCSPRKAERMSSDATWSGSQHVIGALTARTGIDPDAPAISLQLSPGQHQCYGGRKGRGVSISPITHKVLKVSLSAAVKPALSPDDVIEAPTFNQWTGNTVCRCFRWGNKSSNYKPPSRHKLRDWNLVCLVNNTTARTLNVSD